MWLSSILSCQANTIEYSLHILDIHSRVCLFRSRFKTLFDPVYIVCASISWRLHCFALHLPAVSGVRQPNITLSRLLVFCPENMFIQIILKWVCCPYIYSWEKSSSGSVRGYGQQFALQSGIIRVQSEAFIATNRWPFTVVSVKISNLLFF